MKTLEMILTDLKTAANQSDAAETKKLLDASIIDFETKLSDMTAKREAKLQRDPGEQDQHMKKLIAKEFGRAMPPIAPDAKPQEETWMKKLTRDE